MKDPRHHRTKLQKRVFREAKKHALANENHEEKNSVNNITDNSDIIIDESLEIHKKKVPIIRKHKSRFH
ncbi:MAG: hypothetical protein ACI9S8_001587 [Chlamydiales bacterium]|jgi:hypothetical protein